MRSLQIAKALKNPDAGRLLEKLSKILQGKIRPKQGMILVEQGNLNRNVNVGT
jgi:hypothetical protein